MLRKLIALVGDGWRSDGLRLEPGRTTSGRGRGVAEHDGKEGDILSQEHTREAGRVHRTRPAAPLLRLLGLAFAAALVTLVPLAQAAVSNPKCTAEQGQAYIDEGRYDKAIHEFTCLVNAAPTDVDGYRGRAEAGLLLGRYSDAFRDYTSLTAYVIPVHPDAERTVLDGYAARLATDPGSVSALTGASFARWVFFDYPQAIKLLNRLLELKPDDPYGTLFRGSSRLLKGVSTDLGTADLEQAIALAPTSPDVRFIVADAYTYGQQNPERAFAEAALAFEWGLDTPRIHSLLASALNFFGETETAASHIATHIEQVTTELVPGPPLGSGEKQTLDLVPGRTFEIPVPAIAGETISISTSSKGFRVWDSIAVLRSPDGTPVIGSDDDNAYFAAFDWVAEETGTYLLSVTSFEAVSTGQLIAARG